MTARKAAVVGMLSVLCTCVRKFCSSFNNQRICVL